MDSITTALSTATATIAAAPEQATITAQIATSTAIPSGYSVNYPHFVKWSSAPAAYVFAILTALITICMFRNLVTKAKARHTKMIYLYLFIWGLFRFVSFILRGYILTDNNGTQWSVYVAASILSSVGFMPLCEVMAFCTLEGSSLAFGFTTRQNKMYDLLIKFLFATFGTTVTAFAIDFTCNKPFGSNPKDYHGDLALREFGFDGLILLTVYALVGSLRNYLAVATTGKVPGAFVGRYRMMMGVIVFQAMLMIIKLTYTVYRAWNPYELRDEGVWYILSIFPEYIFVFFYVNHHFLKVYDDIEEHTKKAGDKESLESIGMDVKAEEGKVETPSV
ncbi:hypothetical protein BC830DRAFT_1111689 [Chytriomyces sp. MP71]|nr:hypothetical protein BC830DRAFT_1111689 [Chytriomyces sp. MP71]